MIFKRFYEKTILKSKVVWAIVEIGFILLLFLTLLFIGNEIALFIWNEKNIPGSDYFLDFSKIGQLGDILGGLVGSIWALTGVLFFYQALKDQKKATELMSEQVQEQRILQFETALFNLFNNYSNRLANLKFSGKSELLGNEIFAEAIKKASKLKYESEEAFKVNYIEKIHSPFSLEINTLVDGLYSLLKFIDTSVLLKNDRKNFYGDLVRSLLTIDQLAIVLYECVFHESSEKLALLLDNYSILRNRLSIIQRIDQDRYKKGQEIWNSYIEIIENTIEIENSISR